MIGTVESGLQPFLRMPTGFGPSAGPRNVPRGMGVGGGPERRTTVAYTAPIRSADVEPLLPRGVSLRAARMTVSVQKLANLRWLAGRGYDIVSVSFPVRCAAVPGDGAADYLAVLWESMAEPIITGREELGFPKLYADIEAADFSSGDSELAARASWDGTTFFAATARQVRDVAPAPRQAPPTLTHRYLPAVGRLADAEVDHLTVTDPAARAQVDVVGAAAGEGEFAFEPVTWEQVPVQQQVINRLAAIRVTGPAAVQVTCVHGSFSGVGNLRLPEVES